KASGKPSIIVFFPSDAQERHSDRSPAEPWMHLSTHPFLLPRSAEGTNPPQRATFAFLPPQSLRTK
ncbi:MAG TPA: hypothetical protein VFA10_15625, partial [Ktedonobacteraceae bacterium]|nr:hypothetical protein [Ktedonobacteraceae bacterium]